MTSFWLFLSSVFKWSFGFFDFAGNVLNWILFFVALGFFCYWCYILIVQLGNNKDKEHHNDTYGKHPYYDPKIYNKEN
ncbi:hypothetical protein [Halpernia sp.]|uniref:hypothetical protein n=1 Tax=Halpernia sp. TaxID=2782209 RepID=UPI003A8F4689